VTQKHVPKTEIEE